MIRVRVDDFPQTRAEPQHTLAAYRDFHRRLSDLIGGRRYLLGVIPRRCSVEDVLFLRNETDCIIGMHGIEHDEAKLDLYGNEFPPWLGHQDVGRMLIGAADALDSAVGRRSEIYMPPRNRIDRRTADVLLDCGFLAYTTGPETDPELLSHPVLTTIHSQPPHEYGRTDEMFTRQSYRDLNEMHRCAKDVVLTLHWTWETNIGLQHMDRFFEQIPRSHFADFD